MSKIFAPHYSNFVLMVIDDVRRVRKGKLNKTTFFFSQKKEKFASPIFVKFECFPTLSNIHSNFTLIEQVISLVREALTQNLGLYITLMDLKILFMHLHPYMSLRFEVQSLPKHCSKQKGINIFAITNSKLDHSIVH